MSTKEIPPPTPHNRQLCYGNDNKPPQQRLRAGRWVCLRRKRDPRPHPPTSEPCVQGVGGRLPRRRGEAPREKAMFQMPELFPRRRGLDTPGAFGPDVSAAWVALTRAAGGRQAVLPLPDPRSPRRLRGRARTPLFPSALCPLEPPHMPLDEWTRTQGYIYLQKQNYAGVFGKRPELILAPYADIFYENPTSPLLIGWLQNK